MRMGLAHWDWEWDSESTFHIKFILSMQGRGMEPRPCAWRHAEISRSRRRLNPGYLGPQTAVYRSTACNWLELLLTSVLPIIHLRPKMHWFSADNEKKRNYKNIYGRKRNWPKLSKYTSFGAENENEFRSVFKLSWYLMSGRKYGTAALETNYMLLDLL